MAATKAFLRVVLTLLLLSVFPDAATAAYPGDNGRIAFERRSPESGLREIWTVNPDGSDPRQLTHPPAPNRDFGPRWSPDGSRVAFTREYFPRSDIYVINADGTGETLLAEQGFAPTWSPDGTEIAFIEQNWDNGRLVLMNADGTGGRTEFGLAGRDACCPEDSVWSPSQSSIAFTWLHYGSVCDPYDEFECRAFGDYLLGIRHIGAPSGHWIRSATPGSDPNWSPNGQEIVYRTGSVTIDYYTRQGTEGDIGIVGADGNTGRRTIVSGPDLDESPAWSPDGEKILFNRERSFEPGLWVVGADGSNPTRILARGDAEFGTPDWQPLQRPYARPAAAGPVHVPLVTAFEPCTAANREHGPPLAFPSCSPPLPASPNLIVSVGEAYQSSTGFVRVKPIVGTTGQPDDSDVLLRLRITNVMNASDRSDYTGVLRPEVTVRLTDRDGFQHQTTQDFPFGFDVPCTATASTTVGGLCDLATTADAVVPGAVPEGTRAIWQLGQVKVYDGGPAGDGTDPSLFAVQGVFVP